MLSVNFFTWILHSITANIIHISITSWLESINAEQFAHTAFGLKGTPGITEHCNAPQPRGHGHIKPLC